ncbi:MAG: penicillin-binding protein 1A [Stappiaceae bacterium]
MVKLFGYFFGIGAVFFLLISAGVWMYLTHVSADLPDYSALKNYEPPVMTRVHASDGQLMAEYARERRMFLPIQAVPEKLKQAYLSAEDKNFYSHGGLDFSGIAKAMVQNVQNYGSGRRPVGASTITQQVAKNFFFTNEVSYERKMKEAILAMRIEQTYSKDEILELYLNEIYLGIGAYGVAAASLMYFDKSVHELTLAEMAYLAALPKAPNNYHPIKKREQALERRNWVLDRMAVNGYVTHEEADRTKSEPLNFKPRPKETFLFASDYFSEEVRRELAGLYGEERLYGGGLSVRTTLDPELQILARKALMDGLIKFDRQRGRWRGPISSVDISAIADWGEAFKEIDLLSDVPEWKMGVVLEVADETANIGIQPLTELTGKLASERETGILSFGDMKWARGENGGAPKVVGDVLNVGDIVYVEKQEALAGTSNRWKLQQVPEISGALIAMDPYTGRVLALSGGFSFAQSEFNRATQAYRQPGSSFKPFVYAAALDQGYTPSSVVMDAPIEVQQGGSQGIWRPSNYSNKYYGPSTLRTGIELSRNVMTVRLAQDMGMPTVAEYSRRFGIYDNMQEVLSMSLGAGETTVLRLTSAYSMMANGGRKVKPTLIDRIQDRHGKTIFKHEERMCDDCAADKWADQEEPELVDNREQVLDPMTAYQITSMMEGVVQRGTAPVVREVGRPIAGKTGTTNDEKDAWFVGYSPDLAVGVFVGYDKPRRMGRGATGGQIAAPIFTEFMKEALADQPAVEFRVPQGINLISINRRTGLSAPAGTPGSILEAFKPGTYPPDTYSVIGYEDVLGIQRTVSPEAERAVTGATGGLY